MNTRERFVRTLTGQAVDRVPFIKVFGGEGPNGVRRDWKEQHPELADGVDELLKFEGRGRGWRGTAVNMDIVRNPTPEIIEENEQHIVRRWEHGAVEIIQKGSDFGHQTIEWPVKNRKDWERVKAKHLRADDPARFPSDWNEAVKDYKNRDYPLSLFHCGVYGFARNIMGDEHLAYAFYDDPDLVHEIMDSYTELAIAVWSQMTRDVEFDLIECWEDMASNNGMLISPSTFREFMKPNYMRISEFARRHKIRIILVDSDGLINELTGLMLESGVTAMYPYEVQAGNNLAQLLDKHPVLGALGGLNKQAMAMSKKAIKAELDKARKLIRKGRYIPGPDHFPLTDVSWENYRDFMDQLREVVMTTEPGN